MNKSYSKQISNREVNGSVNAAQTKVVLSPEGKLRTNLSATVDLRKNENLEHNSSMIKNHKTKQNINSEVNGNVNAAQTKNVVRELLHAAEQGDANAQFILGVMYANGDGVPKDFAEAGTWCRKAAEQGYANAQFMLGKMYQSGDGVPKDSGEAGKWYRLAAEQGYVVAQLNLGYMYDIGNGVTKDGAEAEKWYLKAADAGLAIAQANLGELYWIGSSVPKNEDEAIKWFRRAAEQGYSKWQLSVARNYFEGQSTQKNLILAFAWSKFAAEQGDEDAKMQLVAIEKEINFQQKAEAEKLVRELYNKLPTKRSEVEKSALTNNSKDSQNIATHGLDKYSTSPGIDRQKPQPRLFFQKQQVRPGIFVDNKKGAKTGVSEVVDSSSRMSCDVYLKKMIEMVQFRWNNIMTSNSLEASSGTTVTVSFRMNSSGTILQILDVKSTTTDECKNACLAALASVSTYGGWSRDMIDAYGDKQDITLSFNYN